MTGSSSDIGRLKYGRDADREAEANKWLYDGVGKNKRTAARDAEKMKYEHGWVTSDELQYYDPANDWDTKDSAYSIVVDPGDADWVESTICADVDDGNIRRRHDKLLERKALMRHMDDSDSWGLVDEEIPRFGLDGIQRKVCTRCRRSKGTHCFYAHPKTKDGLQSQCKPCQKVKNANPGDRQ